MSQDSSVSLSEVWIFFGQLPNTFLTRSTHSLTKYSTSYIQQIAIKMKLCLILIGLLAFSVCSIQAQEGMQIVFVYFQVLTNFFIGQNIWNIIIEKKFFSIGGFICTFSLLSSLSFTFQSSKFNYSSSSQWQLKWLSQFRCQFRCQFAVPHKR